MVVTKDRVVATPRSAMRSIPRADETMDVTGQWIVPGFVDNHVHLGRIRPDPEIWIRAGVTTLVDNGSSATGAELARRYRSGPGIEPCGLIISEAGGYPAVGQKDAPALQVHGSEDAERKTSEFIERAHPACIKIAIERGFLEDLNDQGWPALDAREVAAIVKVAHARHLSVRARHALGERSELHPLPHLNAVHSDSERRRVSRQALKADPEVSSVCGGSVQDRKRNRSNLRRGRYPTDLVHLDAAMREARWRVRR